MHGLFARLALPALIAATALLALRLLTGVAGLVLPPVAGLAWSGLILALLLTAIGFASMAARFDPRFYRIMWAGLALGFGGIFSFDKAWEAWEFQRDWGDQLVRSATPTPGEAETPIVLRRQGDGHFYMTGEAGSGAVDFLVDTGATGVMLTLSDARRIGMRTERLDYTIEVSTASGLELAAPSLLPALTLHGHRFDNVPILVMRTGDQSLLGMSVLSQFTSVEMRADRLVLQR